MKLITLILLLNTIYSANIKHLISDYDFTNQKYTLTKMKKFCKKFDNNKLKQSQIYFIYHQCKYFQIHPLIIFTKIEQESGIIRNNSTNYKYSFLEHRVMAYGLTIKKWIAGKKYYKYGFYEVQIFSGAKTLRKYFNKWKSDKKITVVNLNTNMTVSNASTYSLYKYTPFYGGHAQYGWKAGGNEIFIDIYKRFKKIWSKIK